MPLFLRDVDRHARDVRVRAHVSVRLVTRYALALAMVPCAADAQSTGATSTAPARATSTNASQPAGNAAAERVYDRAAQNYATLKTIDAQFDQQIHNPLLGRTLKSHGHFQQQRPNLVSITFTDPAGDRIVGDGSALWVYLPSSAPGQVMKLPANADGAMLSNLFGELLDAPRKSFVISGGEAAPVNSRASHRVQLVPRVDGSVPFQRATLWIDDGDARPLQVQLLDAQGVERTITIVAWTTNGVIPKDAFHFTPPPGVKVVRDLPGTK